MQSGTSPPDLHQPESVTDSYFQIDNLPVPEFPCWLEDQPDSRRDNALATYLPNWALGSELSLLTTEVVGGASRTPAQEIRHHIHFVAAGFIHTGCQI